MLSYYLDLLSQECYFRWMIFKKATHPLIVAFLLVCPALSHGSPCKIQIPSPREVQMTPAFQKIEQEYADWSHLKIESPSIAAERFPEVQSLSDLKNSLFQVDSPKRVFQEQFANKYEKLGQNLEVFTIVGVGMMTAIALMPESFSQWNLNELWKGRVVDVYRKKVSAGPVLDHDAWAVNFIGHPVSGAAYYLLARHSGFSWAESMTFSILMSTFFWEYGLEAIIEIPSIQDLIITPLIGSLMGEAFYQAEQAILRNDGRILGSKLVGDVSRVLLDPAGSLVRTLISDKPPGTSGFYETRYFAELRNFGSMPGMPGIRDPGALQLYYGIRLKIWF